MRKFGILIMLLLFLYLFVPLITDACSEPMGSGIGLLSVLLNSSIVYVADMELVGEYNITSTDNTFHVIAVLNASGKYFISINGIVNLANGYTIYFSPGQSHNSSYWFGLDTSSGPLGIRYYVFFAGPSISKVVDTSSNNIDADFILDFETEVVNATVNNVKLYHTMGGVDRWGAQVFSIEYYGDVNATIKVYKIIENTTNTSNTVTTVTTTVNYTVTDTATVTNTVITTMNYTRLVYS